MSHAPDSTLSDQAAIAFLTSSSLASYLRSLPTKSVSNSCVGRTKCTGVAAASGAASAEEARVEGKRRGRTGRTAGLDAREEPFAPARERAAKREEGAAAAAIVDEATTIFRRVQLRRERLASSRQEGQRKRRRTRERGAAAALEAVKRWGVGNGAVNVRARERGMRAADSAREEAGSGRNPLRL